jgi:hypothetical protein
MQVIHHYTCFGDGGMITNKKKAFKSLVLKKAILAQLVEIDGIDLLVGVLEEQLQLADNNNDDNDDNDDVNDNDNDDDSEYSIGDKEMAKAKNKNKKSLAAIGGQYAHVVSKSIWSVLMNVGACEHAVKLLKQTKTTAMKSGAPHTNKNNGNSNSNSNKNKNNSHSNSDSNSNSNCNSNRNNNGNSKSKCKSKSTNNN